MYKYFRVTNKTTNESKLVTIYWLTSQRETLSEAILRDYYSNEMTVVYNDSEYPNYIFEDLVSKQVDVWTEV